MADGTDISTAGASALATDATPQKAAAPSQEGQEDISVQGSYNIADAIDHINICELLTDEQVKEIGALCLREFEIDDQNFTTRRARIEEHYKLALQVKEPKNYPFENASNIKYPLLTKATLAFAALAYPAMIKDDMVVKGKVIGNDDGLGQVMDGQGQPMIDPDTNKPMLKNAGNKKRRGERVSTFMSWQVLEDMVGWEEDMDKICHINPIIGCSFKKTLRDTLNKKNDSRLVLPQYLVININAKTIDSAFRVSEIYELYPNEIEENIRAGIFRKFEYTANSNGPTQTDSYKPSDGDQANSGDEDKPHQFIQQHRWLDLDDDGYAEPYYVDLHKDTREVARIVARFGKDDIIAGKSEPDAAGVVLYDNIMKINAECYYEKFGFIPDPEGSIYDIGFGHLLQHLNEGTNTSINQLIDAGHRNIMGGGFVGSGLRIKSGDMRFKPGEYKRVDSQGAALKDSVVPLNMPAPNQVLLELLQFLISAADSISQTSKGIGDQPANMPATTALASVQEGLQAFKAIYKRLHRGLKSEFKRLFFLNRKYLTQEEYMAVLDDEAADVKKDFDTSDVSITPISDPDMVNNIEMIMRANVLAQYKDDPLVDGVEVRKRIFEAINIKDIDKLVKIPPKVTDELMESQKKALDAQAAESAAHIEKMNRDNEREDIETALNIEETQSKIRLNIANAVLALGKANQADQQIRIDQFMADLTAFEKKAAIYDQIVTRRQQAAVQPGSDGNIAGGNKQLAQSPGQPGGSSVPAGSPAPDGGDGS